VIDPAIESHYGTGYERSRLFPGGRPSLEFVRSMELLDRLLPAPPARLLDVGGGPGTYAAPLARRGYRVQQRCSSFSLPSPARPSRSRSTRC
jgi:2-polyprenyl-3-methyl-5-hydroxy-6-metoxy-1,4-benzoquinol methylase